jgi:hypothetical protein
VKKLAVYLAGGQTIQATVSEVDLEGETIEDYLEDVLGGPPRWAWIGDVRVYTQAVSAAVEL